MSLHSFGDNPSSEWKREIEIKEGQSIKLDDINLTVFVKTIKNLEEAGCHGGPIGCPIEVLLDVTKGKEAREIRLSYRKAKKTVGVKAFDYEFGLTRVQEKQITLLITQ